MSVTTAETSLPTTEPAPKSHLRPRRTLNRLALAVVGLLFAAAGQYFFSRESLWDGLLLYGVAVILFVKAVGNYLYPNFKFSLPNPHQTNRLSIYQGWRRNAGIWLMLVAVAASALSYTFFPQNDGRTQAWWLYLASLTLFVAGTVLLTPNIPLKTELRHMFPNRRVVIWLAVILAMGVFLRLFNFTEQPFGIWYDEAEAGLQARQLIQNNSYRPIFYPAINVTGHLLSVYALALTWLGNTIYSMRLVSVLFGLGGIIAAFLFGNALRGPRFGLALAFFIAVSRWHINFSRVAMTGVDAPFFEFLSLFFLTRLIKRGYLRDALWAGLALGFGLTFYTAFRLFGLALLLFFIIAAIRWGVPVLNALRHSGWRRYLGAAVILLVSGWLVVMPIARYAIDHPEAFWYRTRQISILTKRDQADLSTALRQSAQKHLLMFNVSGDKNGRHNLPGEPMLDGVMGMLLVLGLGLALYRTRYPANTFFLILLPVGLVGGVFSVDFEAPQSLRSIAVIPAIVYFCALTTAALGKEAERALQPLPRGWVLVPAMAAAALIFAANAYTYFYRQGNDFASWNAFSAPETITGRKMAELGPDYVYILSPFLTNHPTTRFLAPEITHQQFLTLPDALPVRDATGRPVAMFIHPDDVAVFDDAKRLYRDGRFEILSGPSSKGNNSGPPSVYFVALQPANLNAVRGLDLRYLPPVNNTTEQSQQILAPLHTSRVSRINVLWPDDSPTENDFAAEWSGILYVPRYGPYGLRMVSPGAGRLEIDGNIILEGPNEQSTGVTLAQGNHTIRMKAEKGVGQAALYWQPPGQNEELVPNWALYALPVSNHGLLGTFYPNQNWEGQPAFQRIDPYLDSYFHLVPLNRPYSVEWSGSLVAPQSGVYRLGLRAVQEAQLFLDGQPIINTTGPNIYTETGTTLNAGRHDLRVLFKDTVDRSRLHLSWVPPNGSLEPIPKEYLWPPMGSYPVPETVPQQNNTQISPFSLKHLATMGLPGNEPGQFLDPRDVTILSNGNLVVADTGNRRIQIFDSAYTYLTELTGGEIPFEEPVAVDVLRREAGDEILVLDSNLQWIYRYGADGNFIDRFGGPDVRMFHPRGLTVFEDNTIGVADTGTSRLVLFNANGDQIGNIGGGPGDGAGQFNEPTDAIKDQFGTYFVVEAENKRIQRVDSGGSPLNQWSVPSAYAYNGPHLTFGPDGSIFMTESQGRDLLRYTPTGLLIDQWRNIGPVNLNAPVGIYFDHATGHLYLTDVASHQVHIFKVEASSEGEQ